MKPHLEPRPRHTAAARSGDGHLATIPEQDAPSAQRTAPATDPIAARVTAVGRLDLSQLAVDRGTRSRGGSPSGVASRRRRWAVVLSRYVVPGALLAGFVLLLAYAARQSLLPAQPVSIMPVLTSRVDVARGGEPLFQCAGWVEPRPTPILVPALADGVVDRLLVVEDQQVARDEPVAQLIDVDARLELEAAEAELALREADLLRAKAELSAARDRDRYPVHLEAPLAEARAALARVETELASLPSKLAAAEAQQRFARLDLDGKLAAKDALAQRLLHLAQSELDAATATVEELRTRQERLETEAAALQARRDTLRRQLDLRIDERREVETGTAKLQAAEAMVRQARNAVDAARLRLERMTVRAPRAGRVLRLVARPGSRVSSAASDSADASTVVTLYDPKMLQLRTDVPLDQVPRVEPGQPVKIETEAVPGGLDGVVLYRTALTDLQKNTLDVKVAIVDPPGDLRPDMLARVTYLAPARDTPQGEPATVERLLVPGALVDNAETGPRVWVADLASGVARSKAVKLGRPAGQGDLVEVLEGLAALDKLIVAGREQLADGMRIRVVGEDTSQGVERVGPRGPSKKIQRIVPGA